MFTGSKHMYGYPVQYIFVYKRFFLNLRLGKQKTKLWFNELYRIAFSL